MAHCCQLAKCTQRPSHAYTLLGGCIVHNSAYQGARFDISRSTLNHTVILWPIQAGAQQTHAPSKFWLTLLCFIQFYIRMFQNKVQIALESIREHLHPIEPPLPLSGPWIPVIPGVHTCSRYSSSGNMFSEHVLGTCSRYTPFLVVWTGSKENCSR